MKMSILEFEYKNIRKISSLRISFFNNEGDVINAVEDVSVSAPSVQKIIKEDQLLIIRDGKMYNIMGAQVK